MKLKNYILRNTAKESFSAYCLVHHLFHFHHKQFMPSFTISYLAVLIPLVNSFPLFCFLFNSLLYCQIFLFEKVTSSYYYSIYVVEIWHLEESLSIDTSFFVSSFLNPGIEIALLCFEIIHFQPYSCSSVDCRTFMN